jgi:hypothetical protein
LENSQISNALHLKLNHVESFWLFLNMGGIRIPKE